MVESSLSYLGVVLIGLVHGAEPGHGWPVAASYALNRSRTWSAGLAAGVVIGLGHLVSSVAVVVAFVLAADVLDITELGWIRYIAGTLLILLGLRELRGGGHRHGGGHTHEGDGRTHDDSDHSHDHDGTAYLTSVTAAPPDGDNHGDEGGFRARLARVVPFVVGHSHDHDDGGHSHDHGLSADDPNGLWGIVGVAFLLGFAHEEIQTLGFCTGASGQCVELMLVYALAVVIALVALTLLLVAGFDRYEERMAGYAEYFHYVSGGVLVLVGLGFVAGVL